MANPIISLHNPALLLLLFLSTMGGGEPAGAVAEADAVRYVPVQPVGYHPAGAPFQLCLLCRCCAAGDPTNCSNMPCCFGINCSLPDKPYGVCAFAPKTCDCNSCN